MNDWTTVLIFTYPQDAYIVKGALEANGITTFLKDELVSQIQSIYSGAIGGAKLQVLSSEYEQACEILREAGYEPIIKED